MKARSKNKEEKTESEYNTKIFSWRGVPLPSSKEEKEENKQVYNPSYYNRITPKQKLFSFRDIHQLSTPYRLHPRRRARHRKNLRYRGSLKIHETKASVFSIQPFAPVALCGCIGRSVAVPRRFYRKEIIKSARTARNDRPMNEADSEFFHERFP